MMNVTKVYVHDPTLSGILERPHLVVEVNEEPTLTQGPDSFLGGWTISKYKGLISYNRPGDGAPTAADFNARFQDMMPIVDVRVEFEVRKTGNYSRTTYGLGTFALQLQRARQYLRRYASDWRLMAADYDMQARRLVWTPTQANAICRQWLGETICGMSGAVRIRIGDVDMPLCSEHRSQYQREQKAFQSAFKG